MFQQRFKILLLLFCVNYAREVDSQQAQSAQNNLGATIQAQVYQSLRPVRDMQAALKIKQGTGGVTIATFNPSGQQFIIRDGILYACTGSISESTGSCSGDLQKFSFSKKKDFCYANVNNAINNVYCIVPSGSASFSVSNGQTSCSSKDGSPSLLISARDYDEMCRGVATEASYKYFTNQSLGEHGTEVSCSGNKPQICTMTSSLRGSTGRVTGGVDKK